MANNYQHARGALVAEVLSGAWRESPAADHLSPDKVAAVSSLLYSSGSAALGWWRIRNVSSEQWVGSGKIEVGGQRSEVSSRAEVGGQRSEVSSTAEIGGQRSDVRHKSDSTAHRPLPTAHSSAHSFLHDAYRQARLAALVHEQEIKHVLSLLRAVDIEPVLVKGWAIARLYPDRALRPYGDIDLCVRPDQFEKAAAALKCLESIAGHYVDLHAGFGEVGQAKPDEVHRLHRFHRFGDDKPDCLSHVSQASRRNDFLTVLRNLRNLRITPDASKSGDNDWDELFARSRLVPLGDEEVRVLCDEDHLRLLCLHLLRSGAWRPLWLCDVALLLEKVQGPGFDWDVCLGSDPLYADWVAVTVGLAHQLLGVEVKDTPVAERAKHLPRWLVPAVLKQWGRPRSTDFTDYTDKTLKSIQPQATGSSTDFAINFSSAYLCNLRNLRMIYRRWDNPVRATAAVHGQFNNWPRLPYRLRESVMRSRELPKALASMFRESVSRKRASQPLSLIPDS